MKAVILINPYLSEERELYQPRRIAEELAARGVGADILPNAWTAHTERGGLASALAKRYAFCVYLDKDRYAARSLEACGMRLFNRAEAVELCDDKMLTHIALAGKVPMPETYFAPLCYKGEAEHVSAQEIGEKLGYPVVVKECFGSLGEQVFLAHGYGELTALMQRLKPRPHILQKFIAESAGQDLRVIAVGGETAVCMRRTSEHDFRSNIACGGRGEPFPPTEEVRAIARRVSETLRLDYCGIDLLFGKEGMLVCEVNSNAFFGGIERVTGVNVASLYVSHICREMGI